MNAGTIRNKGIELQVTATPVRLDNGLEWEIYGNYSKNNSEVEELYGDLETIVLDSYYGVDVEARKGEPYGQMYGRMYATGQRRATSWWAPTADLSTPPPTRWGSWATTTPTGPAGLGNRLSYGAFTLNVLIDTQQGGSVFSMTNRYGVRSGVLEASLWGRELYDENGVPLPPSEGGGLIVPGVKVVAGDTVPNDIRVAAQDYHRGLSGIAEAFTYDASFVKLREIRLGYQVPRTLHRPDEGVPDEPGLVGRNLFLWTDVPNIDPETAFNPGNAQGYEWGQFPSARSFGLSVSAHPQLLATRTDEETMKIRMIFRAVPAAVLIAAMGGCGDGLTELNENPNQPVSVGAEFLLPAAMVAGAERLHGSSLNMDMVGLWVQHYAEHRYAIEDRYEFQDVTVNGHWSYLYESPLRDLYEVVEKGKEAEWPNVEAVGTILTVWLMQAVTDLWGDAGFSQALLGRDSPPEMTVVYDTQQEIYDALLANLSTAASMISPSGPKITDGDLIYGGDMDQWRLFANSLRLRAAMRLSEVDPTRAASEVASAISAGVFTCNCDNAILQFVDNGVDVHPIFGYERNRDDHSISATLVDTLKALNDPRLPIYARPNGAGEYVGTAQRRHVRPTPHSGVPNRHLLQQRRDSGGHHVLLGSPLPQGRSS